MEFRILGPLEVEEDGRTIPLAGAKQRSLLALLVLGPRQAGLDRPSDRGDLERGAAGDGAEERPGLRLATAEGAWRRPPGHARARLRARRRPGELDADRFDELVRAASGAAPAEAAARLREALAPVSRRPAVRSAARALGGGRDRPAGGAPTGGARGPDRRRPCARTAAASSCPNWKRSSRRIRSGSICSTSWCSRSTAPGVRPTRSRRTGAAQRGYATSSGSSPAVSCRSSSNASCDRIRRSTHPRRLVARAARRRGWKLVLAGAAVLVAAAAAAVVVMVDTRRAPPRLPPCRPASRSSTSRAVVSSRRSRGARSSSRQRWPRATAASGSGPSTGSRWCGSIRTTGASSVASARRSESPRNGFLVDGRDLWFTGTRLVRTDIALGREVDRYPLSKDPHDDGLTGIARGDGSLWIARHQAGELLRVDPASGKVQRRFRNLPAAYQVAYGDGGAWVVTGNMSVERVDAATNTVTRTPVPSPFREHRRRRRLRLGLERGEGHRLQDRPLGPDRRDVRDRRRSKADVVRGRDALGRQPATWARSPVSTRRPGAGATFRFGHPLLSLAALHGKLLVELWTGAHLRGTDRRAARARWRA